MDYEKGIEGNLINNSFHTEEKSIDNDESCISGLNETGKKVALFLCLGIGFIIQLFAFDSHHYDFIMWYIFGNLLTVIGLGFIVKFPLQLTKLNSRKRKEFLLAYFILVGFILVIRFFKKGEEFFVVILFFLQFIAYFQYARTYVESFDNFSKKMLGDFGNFKE